MFLECLRELSTKTKMVCTNISHELSMLVLSKTQRYPCRLEYQGIASFWGDIGSSMPPHTAVKVNSNAVGTVIGKWWTAGYPYDQKSYKLVDLVETAPH
jgi:hypothetical protein